jgi:hypothetical protein
MVLVFLGSDVRYERVLQRDATVGNGTLISDLLT